MSGMPPGTGSSANDMVGTIASFLRSKGSPLAPFAADIVAAGEKYGVDPRMIVATAGIETNYGKTWGKYKASSRNAWSHEFGRGKAGYPSWQAAIEDQASYLSRRYIKKGITSVSGVGAVYAPVGAKNDPRGTNGQWPGFVGGVVSQLGGNPNDIRMGSGGSTSTMMAGMPADMPGSPTSAPTPARRSRLTGAQMARMFNINMDGAQTALPPAYSEAYGVPAYAPAPQTPINVEVTQQDVVDAIHELRDVLLTSANRTVRKPQTSPFTSLIPTVGDVINEGHR